LADEAVEGIVETIAFLDDVPHRIARRGFPRAITAAGFVLAQEVQARTPRQPDPVDHTHLQDSMVVDIDVNEAEASADAEVGFGKEGYRAFFVEYGTSHAPAHPFMRPAVEAAVGAVTDAFVGALEEAVNEEFGE
jgi:HK97 gp10 family phage protein